MTRSGVGPEILDLQAVSGDAFAASRRITFLCIILIIYLSIYVFLAVLGLCCRSGFALVAASRGYSRYSVRASYCGDFSYCGARALECVGFSSCGSRALEHRLNIVVHGLRCSMACGIFSVQGSNPCLLHWQGDSLPLSHQESPRTTHFKSKC